MVRTQIYLTDEEQKQLFSIAHQTGKKKSELIRLAIDEFILKSTAGNRLTLLKKGRGLWQDRKDLPNFKKLRRELDRGDMDD